MKIFETLKEVGKSCFIITLTEKLLDAALSELKFSKTCLCLAEEKGFANFDTFPLIDESCLTESSRVVIV